jgi:hypothetical protein
MHVAIPSKGRPGDVRTLGVIPSATVYVPEVEAGAYRKGGAEKVVAVPMEVRGITRTRNWILDTVEENGGARVVFVDDDVKASGYFELFTFRAKIRRLSEEKWLAAWGRLFDLAEGFGLRVWGTGTDGALRSVYPYRPFVLHTYITASCMGMWAAGPARLRFDEAYPVKEDYELGLRCLKEDGGVLGARFLFWANDHWGKSGGCKDYRTQEMEEDCIRRLIRQYPGLIRRVTRGGSEYSIELDF